MTLDAGGAPTPDIRDWPFDYGADVVDADGDPSNYNLAGGDRPRLFGDRMAFWIMNDVASAHECSASFPIGIELRTHAFTVDGVDLLESTVFFRIVMTYRGNDMFADGRYHPIENAYVGLWSDVVLGWTSGDYAGVDTTLDLAYAYESSNELDSNWNGRPPAVGITLIDGPTTTNDSLGISTFMEIRRTDDGARCGTEDAYLFMRGLWPDGSPVTAGGHGYGGVAATRFMYPGDPVTGEYWSMENIDGDMTPFFGSNDRRLVLATGPFSMEPGGIQEIGYAIVYARGGDRLDSVVELREVTVAAKNRYNEITRATSTSETKPRRAEFTHYPNPADDHATFVFDYVGSFGLRIYDLLGRLMHEEIGRPEGYNAFRIDTKHWPGGLYVARLVRESGYSQAVKFVVSH